jgi:hypothetical protein
MKMSLNGTGEPEFIHYAESFTIDGLDYHYRLVELDILSLMHYTYYAVMVVQ